MNWKSLFPTLFIVLSLAACSNMKDPQFRQVEKFSLQNINLQEATVGFTVTYYNPNNFGVTVKEAEVDVYIDSAYLGKFQQEQSVGVQKTADFSIPFSGKISLQTALNFDFKSLSSRDVFIKANGFAKVGKAGIFITKPINYSGKHRLDELTWN